MRSLLATTALVAVLATSSGVAADATRPPAPAAAAKGVECPGGTEAAKPDASPAATTAGAEEPVDARSPTTPAPIERSAILPSSGGHQNSAPANIQERGAAVPSSIDCALPAGHPNVPKPGAAQADMPTQSK